MHEHTQSGSLFLPPQRLCKKKDLLRGHHVFKVLYTQSASSNAILLCIADLSSEGGVCLAKESEGARILFCKRCCTETYCSKECQIKDWPSHRNRCRPPTSQPSGAGNLLKTASNHLALTPETIASPFRPGKQSRLRPCVCFDAPLIQYWNCSKKGICSNYSGQCTNKITPNKTGLVESQIQFNCGVKTSTHTVVRFFCSIECEAQDDKAHAHKNIVDIDEYKVMVAEKVEAAKKLMGYQK